MDATCITQWMIAIGTCGSVLVALFYQKVINYLNRPKISMSIEERKPFIELKSSENQSSDKGEELVFRIKVCNTGKSNAHNAIIILDEYYLECSGEYLKTLISPIQFAEYTNLTPGIIASNLNYYYTIATVHRQDEMTTDEQGSVNPKSLYRLFLLQDKAGIRLGKGTFILPIKVFSSDLTTKTFFVKIRWSSDTFSKDKKDYSFIIVSQREFESFKIR